MIRSVIIDDEKKSCDILSTLIERYTVGIDICGKAANITEGAELIRNAMPQLIFLDISMPDGTGFDLLNLIGKADYEVIFTTAHSEYALKAIKQHALDYLLKPIDITELQQAVQKAYKKITDKQTLKNYTALVNNEQAGQHDTIAVAVNNGFKFINSNEIVYLQAKGAYTEITCKNKTKLTSSQPLKHYEEMLSKTTFFRTHHSYLINLSCIEQFNRNDGGYIVMTDGSEVILSKRRKKDFLSLFIR